MLAMSAAMKFLQPPEVVSGFQAYGYQAGQMTALGIVELTCLVIYLIPPLAPLGAILLTGYLGGAVATHVRVGDAFVMPVVIGILVWGALWVRYPGLRVWLPLRTPSK